jgi:hypothetical protein
MKIRTIIILLVAALSGCTTEIELIAPGESMPVVYCLLDPSDSIQYIRVSKTYAVYPGETDFKPDQNEILINEDVQVYLAAEYVDGQQEIFYANLIDTVPKDPGWFPSTANQIYAVKCKVHSYTSYSLYIHFTATNVIVHGETYSMGNIFTVIDPELVPGREATLMKGIDYYVRFKPRRNASMFQSKMTFRFAEIKDGIRTDRSLVFPQGFVFETDTTKKYSEQRISGERFLIDVSRALSPVPGIKRIPQGLDFHISCGGDDLALKIRAENNTQSFSILDVNSFDNAIGVFSCLMHVKINDVPLSRFTMDTLALGSLTRELGFLTAQQIDSLPYEKH